MPRRMGCSSSSTRSAAKHTGWPTPSCLTGQSRFGSVCITCHADMLRHVDHFVVKDLFGGKTPPPKSDARYWPMQKYVHNCIYQTQGKGGMFLFLQSNFQRRHGIWSVIIVSSEVCFMLRIVLHCCESAGPDKISD